MKQLQEAAVNAGRAWKPAVQQAFRQVVLERVREYLSSGRVATYDDQNDPVRPDVRFGSVLAHSAFLAERVPRFTEYLRDYPSTALPEVESFVYWSTERLARTAVVRVTHVSILRGHEAGLPDVLAAGREIFSTHYINASLGVTAVVREAPGSPGYLVYLNRSDVDVVGGIFGGLIRWGVQRRLRDEARDVLQGLRRRLESGEPPR
jgi:hypothetical protein